jgi:hypothetical protein
MGEFDLKFMRPEVLNLHIFNFHIYLWYHQPLIYGCGLPNGLPASGSF